MELVDQFRIIAQCYHDEIVNCIMDVCLYALAAIITYCALWFFFKHITPIIVWVRKHNLRALFLAPFVFACIICGATKARVGTVTYPYTDPESRYLIGGDSYTTNDYVHLQFTKSAVVPNTAWLWVEGCPISITNQSEWADNSILAYSNQFANIVTPFDIYYPSATNYNWIVYTDWTPGPVTHTNGVAYVAWRIGVGKMTNDIAITRTGVYTNDVRVAPNPAITNSPAIPLSVNLSPNAEE